MGIELRTMVDIRADEGSLFFKGWVIVGIACPWSGGVVVVVAPFCEVVCEFETWGVG